jgi:hypothetical protein
VRRGGCCGGRWLSASKQTATESRRAALLISTRVFNFERPLEPARCSLTEFGTGQGHGLAVGVRAWAWSFIFTSPGWARALPAFFFPKARFDESLVTPLPTPAAAAIHPAPPVARVAECLRDSLRISPPYNQVTNLSRDCQIVRKGKRNAFAAAPLVFLAGPARRIGTSGAAQPQEPGSATIIPLVHAQRMAQPK